MHEGLGVVQFHGHAGRRQQLGIACAVIAQRVVARHPDVGRRKTRQILARAGPVGPSDRSRSPMYQRVQPRHPSKSRIGAFAFSVNEGRDVSKVVEGYHRS